MEDSIGGDELNSQELDHILLYVRPCDEYSKEYKECSNFKSRFHQYFIHGKFKDCYEWKTDEGNCYKCIEESNNKACVELLQSEKKRAAARMKSHAENDVWEKRTGPPDDWVRELPKWWHNQNDATFKQLQFQNFYKDFNSFSFDKKSSCTIL